MRNDVDEHASRRIDQDINNIPTETARKQAQQILQSGKCFHLIPRDKSISLPKTLPSGLSEIFQEYNTVEYNGSLSYLSLESYTEYKFLPDYYIIGEDTESTLVFKRNEENIRSCISEDQLGENYPTAYHWIISVYQTYEDTLD